MATLSRVHSFLLILGVLGGSSGCASPAPDPPTEELRRSFGLIGVTHSTATAPLDGILPPRGCWEGAGRGAGVGVTKDFEIVGIVMLAGASPRSGQGGFLALVGALPLGIALVPVVALFGAPHGSSNLLEEKAVEDAVAAIQTAADCRQFQASVAESIVDLGSSQNAARLAKLPPGAPTNGCDTLLELEPTQLVFHGAYEMNPDLQVFVLQPATLRRASDGRVLHRVTMVHAGSRKAKFLDWAGDGAKLLWEELAEADRLLARRILNHLLRDLPSTKKYVPQFGGRSRLGSRTRGDPPR